MKQKVRLTEGDLHRIIRKSVINILRESSDSISPDPFGGEVYGVEEDPAILDKFRPHRLKSTNWSVTGYLHLMQDRLDTARHNKANGMQGFFEDMEVLIDKCEELYRKENGM